MNWLDNNVVTWVFHFALFFVLCRWAGLKTWWAVGLAIGIEIDQMWIFSRGDPLAWWMQVDTWMDLLFGYLGIYSSKW